MPTRPAVSVIALLALAGAARAQLGEPFPPVFLLDTLTQPLGFRLAGAVQADVAGAVVGFAGDVNGDGIDDALVLAPGSNLSYAGKAYVVFGRPANNPYPLSTSLAAIPGAFGFVTSGPFNNGMAAALAPVGDINGDGIADIAIGFPRANPGAAYAGETFVVFGKNTAVSGPFPATLNLNGLGGVTGFRIDGIGVQDRSGYAVARAGDLNGDGIDDIIIGAPYATSGGPNAGAAYVVFGKDTAVSGPFPATLPLASLNGTNGVRFDGDTNSLRRAGWSVAGAGDINADGFDDIIIGAPGALPSNTGAAAIVYGRNTAVSGTFPAIFPLNSLNGVGGFRLSGGATQDALGKCVVGLGDVNGDGIDDLAAGAPNADPNASSSGAAYILFGKDTAVSGLFPPALSVGSLDGATGFSLRGGALNDEAAASISPAGDLNNDGVDDVLLGARNRIGHGFPNVGAAYVVYGRRTAHFGNFPAAQNLESLSNTQGFRIEGVSQSDHCGISVASGGDVNDDGVDDLIVGSHFVSFPGLIQAGAVYVLYGRNIGPCPGDADGDNLVTFADLNIILSHFGQVGPAVPGDLTHDGIVDFSDLNLVLSYFGVVC